MSSRLGGLGRWLLVVVLLGGMLVGLAWANYQFARQSPGGNDFLVHWVGTRTLLLTGQTPYSDAVALEIQTRAYGRAAQPGEHELRPAYPLYSALVFAPFALVADFTLARALWMTFLEVGLLGLVVVSLRLSRWQPNPLVVIALLLFSLIWYHGVRPLINGNAVVWVAMFLALALLALQAKREILAGVLFALATIKPHLVFLPSLLLVTWALAHKRWALLGWFIGAVVGLTLLGMLWVPTWPLQNWAEVVRYSSYNPPTTPSAAFAQWWPAVGAQFGVGLTALVMFALFWEWRGTWNNPPDFARLLWVMSLTLALGQWSGITTDPGNFILLFGPLLLVLAIIARHFPKFEPWGVLSVLLVLLVGLWAIFVVTLEPGVQPQQSPIMFFPLPAVVIAGLYLVRRHAWGQG